MQEAGHKGAPGGRARRPVRRLAINTIRHRSRSASSPTRRAALVHGLANANVARMVIDDINARGGCWGAARLYLEDSATTDSAASRGEARRARQVDVIFGGIYSSTRQAIKGPAVVEGKTLYIYPEQYEGQESDPLIFCTGPVPAQQVDPLIPWLMRTDRGEEVLPAVCRLHLAARAERERSRGRRQPTAATIVGEEYFPLEHTRLPRDGREDHRERRRGGVQHHRPSRAHAVPRAAARLGLHAAAAAGSSARTSTRTS